MPYQSVDELPAGVRKGLTDAQQRRYMHVVNKCLCVHTLNRRVLVGIPLAVQWHGRPTLQYTQLVLRRPWPT